MSIPLCATAETTPLASAQEVEDDVGIYVCVPLFPKKSPVIQKIRQDCASEFVQFERCLRENQDTPTSCSPHVARFVACAETVDITQVCKSSNGFRHTSQGQSPDGKPRDCGTSACVSFSDSMSNAVITLTFHFPFLPAPSPVPQPS